ncbi:MULTISPECIES: DinB family protein [Bhargavaea]|uniref:DinB family protein n=1 Tax=Bhargavaea changchunensis TaxID=2134037 RepID=A0ABW2NH53_9BACL|nr:DinB family protein [Bhargavaea sp. CC-171006]
MEHGKETRKIIHEFGAYSNWLEKIKTIDSLVLMKPIAEGKWSPGEIIAHILKWDEHLNSSVIPDVLEGEGMEFPEFGTFNRRAADYARTIMPEELILEARDARNRLVSRLLQLPQEVLVRPVPSNGETRCPHTGSPYTLIYIIGDFIYHDHHHQKQVDDFLRDAQKHPVR